MRKWRNWQTHHLEGVALARAYGFKSRLPHIETKNGYNQKVVPVFFSGKGRLLAHELKEGLQAKLHVVLVVVVAWVANLAANFQPLNSVEVELQRRCC